MSTDKFLLAGGLLLTSTLATALPMDGGVSFVGNPPSSFSFDLSSDVIDFDDAGNNSLIAALEGDYADLYSIGDTATFYDFAYGSFASPTKIWEAPTNSGSVISFTLESLDDVIEVNSSALTSSVLLTGSGSLSDGSQSTKAYWNMSLNEANGTFSWSSSTANVPEPSSMFLMGLGLAGVICARRSKELAL